MKTVGIIIIILIIFLLCISSSIGGILYTKNKNDDIKIYNEAIDNYNRDYNINYDTENNKLITDDDLEKMESTECIVQSYPVVKDIIVNGIVHKLSYAKISYNIKNYMAEENNPRTVSTDFNVDKPERPSIYLKKELKSVNIGSLIPVEAYLITKEPLEKTSYFKIYYDPNGRIAPPFLSSSYIETIPKKTYLFESITSKFSK
jgi:hypothetical protein